jgi:ATP synthase protein I
MEPGFIFSLPQTASSGRDRKPKEAKTVDNPRDTMIFNTGFTQSIVCCIQTGMAEDKRELYKSLGFLSSVGISMVASTFIGLAMGYFLDKWLGTSPWLTLIFLGFGIISGFRNVFILTARELKRQEKENQEDGDGGG